jgi:hypothetical protein
MQPSDTIYVTDIGSEGIVCPFGNFSFEGWLLQWKFKDMSKNCGYYAPNAKSSQSNISFRHRLSPRSLFSQISMIFVLGGLMYLRDHYESLILDSEEFRMTLTKGREVVGSHETYL